MSLMQSFYWCCHKDAAVSAVDVTKLHLFFRRSVWPKFITKWGSKWALNYPTRTSLALFQHQKTASILTLSLKVTPPPPLINFPLIIHDRFILLINLFQWYFVIAIYLLQTLSQSTTKTRETFKPQRIDSNKLAKTNMV